MWSPLIHLDWLLITLCDWFIVMMLRGFPESLSLLARFNFIGPSSTRCRYLLGLRLSWRTTLLKRNPTVFCYSARLHGGKRKRNPASARELRPRAGPGGAGAGGPGGRRGREPRNV